MPSTVCAPRGCDAEASDHFVEDEQRAGLARDLAQLLQELDRLKSGRRLCTGSMSTAASSSAFLRRISSDLRRAVVEHEHVLGRVRHDARRGRHGAQLLRAAHDHFVEDAVIGAGEERDVRAARDGARDTQGAHHRFGAGVAKTGAIEAGPRRPSSRRRPRAGAADRFHSPRRAACCTRSRIQSGCQPNRLMPKPLSASMYSLPSRSHTREPFERSMTIW